MRNGNLVIKTKREDYTPPGKALKHFTSGQVNSSTHFRYGYFEARVKITPPTPKYQEYEDVYCTKSGFWPAFWLLSGNIPGDSPEYQEFDIFEFFGKICQYEVTTHLIGPNIHTYSDINMVVSAKSFHKYAVEWTPNSSNYYLDDQLVASIAIPPSFENKYCQMILNSAVGGAGGRPNSNKFTYPAEMEVDYVKIYQRSNDIAHIESLYPLPASGSGRGYKICINKNYTFVMPDFPGTIVNFSGAGLNVSSTTSNAFFDPSSYSRITGGGMFKSCTVSASNPGVYMLGVTVTDLNGHTNYDNIHIEVESAPSPPSEIIASPTSCNRYLITTPPQAGVIYKWDLYWGTLFGWGNTTDFSLAAPFYGEITVSNASSGGCYGGSFSQIMSLFPYDPTCNDEVIQMKQSNTNTNTLTNNIKKNNIIKIDVDERRNPNTDLLISPNPFKDEINISLSDEKFTNDNNEVELIDILGKTYLRQSILSGRNILITTDLPSGVYFLRTIKNGKIEGKLHKLIKTD